ncbi:MAG TPA: DUF881 domain-containing protein [Jatrophihabitans sp.]|nr:DUF881 domain-containing protein [Jatrophihabitans sp.]
MTGSTAPGPTDRPQRVDRSRAALNDLLNNTLDAGYQAAAARDRPRRWWDGPLVWVGCLAVGLLLVVAYQQSHLAAPARDAARKELITRITAAQSAANRLENQGKRLAGQVAALRDAQLPANDRAVRAAEVAAGSVAVTGPGMQVELGEPTSQPTAGNGRPGTTPQSAVAVIHDTDVRAVVNQMWSDGAESIAINGLRLTPTSFIRVAGESILVDFSPLRSPYTISAIGNSDQLQVGFAQSGIARRLKTLDAVDGITFKFGGRSKLTLPSVTVGDLQYAALGPAPSPSPAATPSGSVTPSGPAIPTSSPSPRETR